MLQDITFFVSVTACCALTSQVCAQTKKETIISVWEASRSNDPKIRFDAVRRLQKFGESAVPVLMEIWNRGDDTSAVAASVIAELKPASPFIAEIFQKALMGHTDKRLREAAAIALGGVQGGGDDTVNALVAGLEDKEVWVVYRSVISLRQIAGDAKKAVPPLIVVAKRYQAKAEKKDANGSNLDCEVAVHALKALAAVDHASQEEFIVKSCVHAIRTHKTNYVALLVCTELLARMGASAKEGVPELLEIAATAEIDEEVRERAATAINAIVKALRDRK